MAEHRGILRLLAMIFPMLAGARCLQGDHPFYDHQITGKLGGRGKFGFNTHRERLRSIKNRRRTGRS